MSITQMVSKTMRRMSAFVLFALAIGMIWIAYLWRNGPLTPQESVAEVMSTFEILGPFAILLDVIIIIAILWGIRGAYKEQRKDG